MFFDQQFLMQKSKVRIKIVIDFLLLIPCKIVLEVWSQDFRYVMDLDRSSKASHRSHGDEWNLDFCSPPAQNTRAMQCYRKCPCAS